MTKCRHPKTARSSTIRCFSGPVSRRERPAAHGGVCEHETCAVCGATRAANVNGNHVEQGPWTPPPAWTEVAAGCRRFLDATPMFVATHYDVGPDGDRWAVRERVGDAAPVVLARYASRAAAVAAAVAAI